MENSVEEAIKVMEHWIEYEKNNKEKINRADELINIQETVLSELEKKDRIIKEMAGHIILMNDSRGLTNEEKIKYFIDMVEREGNHIPRID